MSVVDNLLRALELTVADRAPGVSVHVHRRSLENELRWDGVTWETPVRSKLVRVRFPAHDCRPDGP